MKISSGSVTVVLTLLLITVTTCHEVLLAPGVQTVVDLHPGARPGADTGLRFLSQPLCDASHVTELGHVFSYVAGADMFENWFNFVHSKEAKSKNLCMF